jgi:hypothetical protein
MKTWSNNDYKSTIKSNFWFFYPGPAYMLLLSAFFGFTALYKMPYLSQARFFLLSFSSIFFFIIFLWFLYFISTLKSVIKSICINNSNITIKKFGSSIELNDESFLSIEFYPITWRVKIVGFLDPKVQGIVIKIKSGESLLISPRTIDYDSLVSELRKFGKLRPDIECNLS